MSGNDSRLCVLRCRVCESSVISEDLSLKTLEEIQEDKARYKCATCRSLTNPVLLYLVENEQ